MAQPTFPADAPSFADGRFVLVARIGAGTVGSVYRGYDRKQKGWRAVKVLAPDRASDPTARERFVATAEAFAGVAHPNLVRVYEVGAAVQPYVVMELVTGGTVAAWVDRHGAMPPGLAAGTVLELARGLAALHAAGIVHGHLRTNNVLVTSGGVRKIGDAGLGTTDGDRGRDLRDLGRMLAGLMMGASPPSLGWIVEECGEALDTADSVADAIEAILGELPPEPPGTPDAVLDRSSAEIPLRPGNHPEILALVAVHKPAVTPAPAAAHPSAARDAAGRRFADPGDYDDQALDAPPVPARVAPPPAPVVTAEPEPTEEAPLLQAAAPDPGPVYVEFTDTPGLSSGGPTSPIPQVEPLPRVEPAASARQPVWVVEETPSWPASPTGTAARSSSWVPPTPAPLDRREEAQPEPEVRASPTPAPRAQRRPAPRTIDVSSSSSPAAGLGCLRWLVIPAALTAGSVLLSLVLVLVLLASGVFEVSGAESGTAESAEQLMAALDRCQPAVVRLVAIGGDEAVLNERLVEFQSRRHGPGQLEAALALSSAVEAAGEQLLGDRLSVDNMQVDHQVRSLRSAHLQYEQARATWEASAESWRGAIAVRLGLASAPDDRWPTD